MGRKIEAWKSFDGLMFESETECNEHETEKKLYDEVRDLVFGKIFDQAFSQGAIVEKIVDAWDEFERIVDMHRGFVTPDLALLAGAGIWMSKNRTYSHVEKMDSNHLQNCYRIANNEKRSGYQVYRQVLLDELQKRGLRKEVKTDESN